MSSEVPVMHSGQRLKLPVFEGPLDLLLHLVKVNEMDIEDIEIAEITRQYLEYLSAMQSLDLEIAGEFLVMAATLLNIKSRSLLPRQEQADEGEEEEEIDEILSTQELVRRLVEYRKFKEISGHLSRLETDNAGIFYRASALTNVPGAEAELPRQDIGVLYEAFVNVLREVRAQPQHRVYREKFLVEEKILEVREILRSEREVNFKKLFQRCVTKEEVITFFLALLELAKGLEITLAQADPGGDLYVAAWDGDPAEPPATDD